MCNGTTAAPSCSPETADVVLPVNASVGGVASVGPLDYIVNPAGCLYWTLGTVYAPGYVPDVSPRAYTGESTQPPVLFRVAVGCTPLFVLPPGPAAGGSPLPAPLEVLALNASSVSLSVPRPLLTPTAGSDACNAPAVGASAFSVSLTALPAGSFDTRFLLASPLGVREAVRSARGSGAWTPSAVIPAAATAGLPASAVTVAATIAGLLPCTAYVAVATVSCAKGDGCLPYLASDWSLAPDSAAFVTPGDCAPPPQSPAGKAGLTSAQAAGVAVGVLALVGALAGVAWWRLRGCPCGGGAALRFKPGWGGAASAEPLHSGVGSAYAEMRAGGF